MTIEQKTKITANLQSFCDLQGSQNKASKMLNGVSSATISQILNGNIDLVADDMWRTIESQIKIATPTEWVLVETRDFKALTKYLLDAKYHSNVFAIIGDAGSGKTKAIEQCVLNTENVYRLSCSEFWNKKYFLQELLQSMGRDYSGLTVAEMMQESINQILKKDKPAIILDEADKLTDQVLYFFITLYNKLEDRCGIVLCATDHLDKRIKRGLKINKKGYKEIYSRIGRKCIELKGVGFTDVAQVCMANGIDDKTVIKKIWDDCEADLRRVKRKIHAIKQKNESADKED